MWCAAIVATCLLARCRFTVKWIKMGSATQAEIEAAVASELLYLGHTPSAHQLALMLGHE
jgi:hypothetical protein